MDDSVVREDGGTIYARPGIGRRRLMLIALWRVMSDFLKVLPADEIPVRRVKFEIVLEWRQGEGPDRVVVAESDFTIQKVRPTTVMIDGPK